MRPLPPGAPVHVNRLIHFNSNIQNMGQNTESGIQALRENVNLILLTSGTSVTSYCGCTEHSRMVHTEYYLTIPWCV